MQKLVATKGFRMTAAVLSLILFTNTRPYCRGQEQGTKSYAGVDASRMGAYRALAELTFQAFQKGDLPASARFARILERTFEKGEEHGGEKSLSKVNPKLFEQVDHSMDAFVEPIEEYVAEGRARPTAATVEAAFNDVMNKLRLADSDSAKPNTTSR
jgi:hypothetical protein